MNQELQEQIRTLQRQFKAGGDKAMTNMAKAVRDAALIVEREAKESFEPGEHIGPHLGTPPHSRSGRYLGSITHRIENQAFGIWIGYVGTPLSDPPYPQYLELGTPLQKNIPLPAYPVLNPAILAHRDEIMEMIKKAAMFDAGS